MAYSDAFATEAPRTHRPCSPARRSQLALRSAMRVQGVSNVELAKRLGVSEGVVRRLVNPDHASRIDGVIDALAALGQCLIIEDQIQEPPDGGHSGSQRVAKR